MDEGGLLSADECACAVAELDLEVESGAQDVLAKKAVFLSLLDGYLETVDCQRILCTDIDKSLACSDAITADGHCLKD